MKRLLVALTLLLGFSPVLHAQSDSPVLSALSGTVEFQAAPDQPWNPATVGTSMPEGSSVRTGPDGRAQVTFPDKAVVWIRESSDFGVESTLPLARKVQVNLGEVKLSVPHLRHKQTFEVHAGNAVAAVRGTTFTVQSLADGTLNVKCAFGHVLLHMLTDAKTYSIPQGTFYARGAGGTGKVALMNHAQENDVLQNWAPGLNDQQRMHGLNQTVQNRIEIHNFAQQTLQQQQQVETLVGQVQQNDFSAGRTLLDAHGNLTQVEEYLIRPDQNDLEFVNIVSRPSYVDNNEASLASLAGGAPQFFFYNVPGAVANRLDSLTTYVSFQTYNNNVSGVAVLPQNLADWPAYFSANNVRPDVTNVVLANQTDPNDIFVVGYFGGWCGNSGPGSGPAACGDLNSSGQNSYGQDTIATDLYIGNALSLNALGQMTIPGASNPQNNPAGISGATMLKMYQDNNVQNYSVNGQANGTLISQNAIPYCTTAGCDGPDNEFMWLGTEEAVINNSGQVQNSSLFTGSNVDLFSLVTQIAGEVEIFAKDPGTTGGPGSPSTAPTNDGGTSPNISATDFVGDLSYGDNIDLVIIPDLAVQILENVATSLSNFSSNNSNNNSGD